MQVAGEPDALFGRGGLALLWSSLPDAGNPSGAWGGILYSGGSGFVGYGNDRADGFSVRCLQD